MSNATIQKIHRFSSDPQGCQYFLSFQMLQFIRSASISNSTINDLACSHKNLKFPKIFLEFQCNNFKRSAGYHKNLKVAKIFFKDPQDLVKTSMLAIFLLVSMLQFKDPWVLIKVPRFLVKC
jgi:hypothetical protein